MAPRRTAASEVVEEEEPHLAVLKFNDALSWRAGRAIPTGDLLKRLEALFRELQELDQGEVDKDSLTKVAKELAGQNLIGHKDKGVRAYTACCLADVLKICAPDAPFTATQLRDIFTLFITAILPALSDPSDAYNVQHTYVLTSLAEVKSIVLLTDISNYDPLILHLFSHFFDIISGTSKASTGEQVSKNVEYHMNAILVTLVDESPALPTQVIDIIMAQFLRAASPGGGKSKANGETLVDAKQSTLLVKELPAAYRMAESICNTCTEKMARHISQYFNDVIMEASEVSGKDSKSNDRRRSSINAESDDEDGPHGPTEADLKELNKAHRLLRELWRASPAVLQNVIPQLEAELSAENIQLRLLATETLGDIISGVGAAGPPSPPLMDPTAYPPLNLSDVPESPVSTSILTTPMSPQSFAQTHPSVYHSFIGRKNDKSAIIRSAWTTAIGRILTTSAGGIGISREDETMLVNGLAEKLNDADDRVRLSTIRAIGNFSFRDVITKLGVSGGVGKQESVLCRLADRARDKKHAVRVEGMTTISKIWGVAAGEILAGNETVISLLGAIPSRIFETFYANDPDVNVLLDHVMFEQLIPLSYPPAKAKGSKQANGESQASQPNEEEPFDADKIRTERILIMIRSLEPKPKKAFFALQARQKSFRDVCTHFLQQCEEYNGGVMDGKEEEIKKKVSQLIGWFVSMLPDKPRATADFWKYAKLHDRRSYALIRYAIALESDFKTVFKAIKEFAKRIEAAPGAPAGLLETLIPIIYRGASLVYNRSHLPAILEFSRNDNHGLGGTAHEVLNEISQKNPEIFKAQVKELCKLLQEQAPTPTRANDLGSVETLRACAAYARKYPNEIGRDRKFTQALLNFAQYGEPPKAAKYAVTILMAATERKEMHARDLLQKSTKDWTYGSDNFLTKLAAISQLLLLETKAMDDATNDAIIDIATQKILLQVRTPTEDEINWQDESMLDEECQAKCLSLKILVNQLRTIQDPENIKTMAPPVFKLLNTLVHKEGEISKARPTPKHHKSRLRLTAAKLLLKICTNKVFEGLLSPIAFNHLALVAQDPIFQVRRNFVEKLQKHLIQDKLPSRFYAILFLGAFEPDLQFRQVTVTWIRSRARIFQEQKSQVMESTITRLLSILAHHPDYSPDAEDLVDTARYILFYVSSVVNEDNIGLIFKYAERVKQVRDAIKPAESDRLYILSDLAQAVIRKWQEKKGWTMQSFPGKIGLSKDIFAPMQTHADAQKVAEKQYLPEEMDDLLTGLIKENEKKSKRKADDNAETPVPKKARTVSTKKTPTKEATTKRPSKSKSSARPSKKIKNNSSPAADTSTAKRRRSGRGVGGKSYADRDDKEDEQEMMQGVSEWRYSDGEDSDEEDEKMRDESEAEGEGDQTSEHEAEDEAEPDEAEAEAELTPTPTPPKINGKSTSSKKVPLRARAVVSQSKAKAVLKPKSKVQPKAKPAAAMKGKGKASVKDIYDFDE